MPNNNELVGKALGFVRDGLSPYVDRETISAINAHRVEESDLKSFMVKEQLLNTRQSDWDASALLKLITHQAFWHKIFRRTLGREHRRYASELRDWRNKWAHQKPFSDDDVVRALDTAVRLLSAVSATTESGAVEKLKLDLQRSLYDRRMRERNRTDYQQPAGQALTGLTPWRDVVKPHRDVSSGLYQQAEFAADLYQVHVGEGTIEYSDPAEFFRRTYQTKNLQALLIKGIKRLTSKPSDPVVGLQTNFGGGKTHSMLALYHLCSGTDPHAMEGVAALMARADVAALPNVRRVVLVGNKLTPGSPSAKRDGTQVNTIWGELAWQLGGREAYDAVAWDDRNSTNPGEKLQRLLHAYSPSLILIDEWVAYARQLHDDVDSATLPAGTFETQFTFAQTLTEAVKAVPNCFLVLSLPASIDIRHAGPVHTEDEEVGGERGKIALQRLQHVCGRIAAPWSPADAKEGFEIVRRRLFEPLESSQKADTRNRVAAKFRALYAAHERSFPNQVGARDYEQRIRDAYPIHPEVFDRLYSDWSTLPRFQRTRGVLRLMAAVIHQLWESNDRNPLIMPADIGLHFDDVRSEMVRYLPEHWDPIIQTDIDGASSLPAHLDGTKAIFGQHAICRRVARTIFLGSAPMAHASKGGITKQRTLLGAVLPGHRLPHYKDALSNLALEATYLYADDNRYRFDTRPTVTKLAAEIAEDLRGRAQLVKGELMIRLKGNCANEGDFAAVHVCPTSPDVVSDERAARLVVLGAEDTLSPGTDFAAEKMAARILESRGKTHRTFRNALVFLAADTNRWTDLDRSIRDYLAWTAIAEDHEKHNLTARQRKQAQQRAGMASEEVDRRTLDTYKWVLYPEQAHAGSALQWVTGSVSGSTPLAVRASAWLGRREALVGVLGPARLQMELNKVPLWRGNHVPIEQLLDDFFSYPYLPRLQNEHVLVHSIIEGIRQLMWKRDTFAYAEKYDEAARRYVGLRVGQEIVLDPYVSGLVVKPDVAAEQLRVEKESGNNSGSGALPVIATVGTNGKKPESGSEISKRPRWFSGSVTLDPAFAGVKAGEIAEDVIVHLSKLDGAKVTVTLEIDAQIPGGIDPDTVRTIRENARSLQFADANFEK